MGYEKEMAIFQDHKMTQMPLI
jgi:hypothetical protein